MPGKLKTHSARNLFIQIDFLKKKKKKWLTMNVTNIDPYPVSG